MRDVHIHFLHGHGGGLGKVAFRDMTSRDFDLIDAEPTQTFNEVLPGLLRRFLAAYGPATLTDAAWFFGLNKIINKTVSGCACKNGWKVPRFDIQKQDKNHVRL